MVIYDLSNGDSVITDEVIWDQRLRSIYSTKSVKQVKGDGSINYGDGFNADELEVSLLILSFFNLLVS